MCLHLFPEFFWFLIFAVLFLFLFSKLLIYVLFLPLFGVNISSEHFFVCSPVWRTPVFVIKETALVLQVVTLCVLVLFRVSVLWFPPLRESWPLLCLLPLAPPWMASVLPPPQLPLCLPLLRSKTTPASPSLFQCSPRAGQRSSYGDLQVHHPWARPFVFLVFLNPLL